MHGEVSLSKSLCDVYMLEIELEVILTWSRALTVRSANEIAALIM